MPLLYVESNGKKRKERKKTQKTETKQAHKYREEICGCQRQEVCVFVGAWRGLGEVWIGIEEIKRW